MQPYIASCPAIFPAMIKAISKVCPKPASPPTKASRACPEPSGTNHIVSANPQTLKPEALQTSQLFNVQKLRGSRPTGPEVSQLLNSQELRGTGASPETATRKLAFAVDGPSSSSLTSMSSPSTERRCRHLRRIFRRLRL